VESRPSEPRSDDCLSREFKGQPGRNGGRGLLPNVLDSEEIRKLISCIHSKIEEIPNTATILWLKKKLWSIV
jgi:hypothetical protein